MNTRLKEHERLKEIIARFAVLMDKPGDPNYSDLIHERMVFAQEFNAHFLREQEDIDKLLRINPTISTKVRERDKLVGQLRHDYSRHICQWTPTLIQTDWPQYRSAVLALQKRLIECMAWEEQNLPLYS